MDTVPQACASHVAAATAASRTWIAVLGGALAAALFALLLVLLLAPRRVTLVFNLPVAPTHCLAPQAHASTIALRLTAPPLPSALPSRVPSRVPPPRVPHAAASEAAPDGDAWLAVPIAYSLADEGFVARLHLGADNVLVVLDSGSANLSVGTADCVKASLCSAHDGAYRPAASPHAINLQAGASLAYASLTVEAAWWYDALALPHVPPAAACAAAPPPLEAVTTEAGVPTRVHVAAAARMDGTSSNILGLMSDYDGAAGDTGGGRPVLEVVLAALRLPRRWCMAAGADGRGWLILGAPPPQCLRGLGAFTWLPSVPRAEYAYMGAPVLRIVFMRVVDTGEEDDDGSTYGGGNGGVQPAQLTRHARHARHARRRARLLPTAPRYLVLDTGTAESYVTAPYDDALHRVGGVPRGAVASLDGLPALEIGLEGGVTLRYAPRQYMLPAGEHGWRTTLHASDPKVAALFGDDAVMLMGIHHMMGLALDVDIQAHRIGLATFVPPP